MPPVVIPVLAIRPGVRSIPFGSEWWGNLHDGFVTLRRGAQIIGRVSVHVYCWSKNPEESLGTEPSCFVQIKNYDGPSSARRLTQLRVLPVRLGGDRNQQISAIVWTILPIHRGP